MRCPLIPSAATAGLRPDRARARHLRGSPLSLCVHVHVCDLLLLARDLAANGLGVVRDGGRGHALDVVHVEVLGGHARRPVLGAVGRALARRAALEAADVRTEVRSHAAGRLDDGRHHRRALREDRVVVLALLLGDEPVARRVVDQRAVLLAAALLAAEDELAVLPKP